MAKDVRFVIGANIDRAEQEIRKLQSTGKDVSDSLANSFEQLGIRSSMAIEKERAAAVGAYDRIKASGVASAQEIARANAGLIEKTTALDKELKGVKTSSDSLGGSFANLKTMATGAIAGFGINDLVQARIEMDKINNSLAATSGATAGGDYKYMRGEVDRLGLSLQSTAKDFASITAASKGTSLEGEQTRKIFAAVTGAATVLGLSADDTSGVLLALNQMISKGTVQAEELKGQLGERLPGAFSAAARAMGLTTAELQKHLEAGTILASDLLPKLADELDKTYGSKTAASARSTQAELNRLHTSFFELKAKAADGDTFAGFFRGATSATKLLGDNLDVVKVGLYAVTGSSVISGLTALAAKIGTVGTLSAVASAGLYGIAAAVGYAAGKALDKGIYAVTGYDISGRNEDAQLDKQLAAAQGKLDAVSEKLRAAEVAENATKEKAAQAKKEAEALMAKELDVFRAHQEAKTALSREQKATDLAMMKVAYDQGLVATEAYYQKEKQIALDAAQEELTNAKAYLAKESALLTNIQGRSKNGKPTAEYVDEQAKHEKAIESVRIAELKLSRTTVEENNKIVVSLKTRDEAYLKAEQTFLESNGQYVAAGQIREQLEKQSIEALRLKADALAGVTAAVQVLADKERANALGKITDRQKEESAQRQYADNYAALQDKIAEGNGKDTAYLSAKSALRDEINKKTEAENLLELARESGNIAEYNHALRMQAAEDIRIGQLTNELDLQRRAANLNAQGNADQIILNDMIAKGMSDAAFGLQKKIDLRNLELQIQQDQVKYERNMAQAISDGNTELQESLQLAYQITVERNRAAGNAINDRTPGTVHSSVSGATGSVKTNDKGKPVDAAGSVKTNYWGEPVDAAGSVTTNYWGEPVDAAGKVINPYGFRTGSATGSGSPFVNLGDPYLGSFATGTNRMPADGYAFLHKDEAVVPVAYNPAVGGQSASQAAVTITGPIHFNFPNVTNQTTAKELARQVLPEIQQLQSRYRTATR